MRRSFGQHIQQSHRDRHIQLACIGAAAIGALNFIPGAIGMAGGEPNAWAATLEGMIFFTLSFGVYKRKFPAAAVLLGYFLLTRLLGGVFNGLLWSIVLTYIFARAAKELWDLRGAARGTPAVQA